MAPRLLWLLFTGAASLLLVSSDAGLVAGAGTEPAVAVAGAVAWAVQVSDLHFSTNDAYYFQHFGDKAGDLRLFGAAVLAGAPPGALLLTGDLVDSKSREGRGRQDLREWQEYRATLDNLTGASGLAEAALLDVRGNHDTFDSPARELDNFAHYAAAGRRNSTTRIYIQPLYGAPAAGSQLATQDLGSAACPAAVLVGIDATPDPGLRTPNNFFAVAPPALLQDLEAALANVQARYRSRGCAAPVLAYGHHPLSTIHHPAAPPQRSLLAALRSPLSALSALLGAPSAPARDTVLSVLARHGASAYVNGHLHGVFGERLHRLHHTPSGGRLLELETSAWKDDRRFRLLTADNGTLSFADLYFNTPTKPALPTNPRPYQRDPPGGRPRLPFYISSGDPGRHVGGHIVTITSPPDARYAPQAGQRAARAQHPQYAHRAADSANDGAEAGGTSPAEQFASVRALVLPVLPAPGQQAPAAKQVWLEWVCPQGGQAQRVPMQASGAQAHLYEAAWGARPGCGDLPADRDSLLLLQVVAEDAGGSRSSSERRAVAARAASPTPGAGLVLVAPSAPAPLDQTAVERLVLWVAWPNALRMAFFALWAVHMFLLLLAPKLSAARATPRQAATPASAPKAGPQQLQGAAGHLLRMAVAPLRGAGQLARSLRCMAQHDALWAPQVLYSAYLAAGPWFAGCFLTGTPPGLFFPHFLLMRAPAVAPALHNASAAAGSSAADAASHNLGGWELVDTRDPLLGAVAHLLLTVLPLTLWTAAVVARWDKLRSRPSSKGAPGFWPLSARQLAAAAPLLYFHYRFLRRAAVVYGPLAVAVSPALAWLLPLHGALLLRQWRAGGAPCKQE